MTILLAYTGSFGFWAAPLYKDAGDKRAYLLLQALALLSWPTMIMLMRG